MGNTPIKANSSDTNALDNKKNEGSDKLREGPCRKVYALLEKCHKDRKIPLEQAMTVCVNEADLLIRCVHKHPAYFHS